MAKIEAYSDYNNKQSSILFKLFLWKYTITSLLPLFGSFELFDRLILRDSSLNSFDDFTPAWYIEVGSSIILGMYIRSFLIMMTFFYVYYKPRIRQWIDRGGINSKLVADNQLEYILNKKPNTRKKDHTSYLGVYKNPGYQIEGSYAEILNILFACFMYWVIMPHIFIPAALVLLTVLLKDKILSNFPLKFLMIFSKL